MLTCAVQLLQQAEARRFMMREEAQGELLDQARGGRAGTGSHQGLQGCEHAARAGGPNRGL